MSEEELYIAEAQRAKLQAENDRLRYLLNAADACLRDNGVSFDSAIRQEIHRELKAIAKERK